MQPFNVPSQTNMPVPEKSPGAKENFGKESFGEADFGSFQQRVERKTGIHLNEYKTDQMRRRIATLALKSGCCSFSAYASLVEHDSARLAEFLGQMTINVTELLRNPNRFEELRTEILPGLLAQRPGIPLSIWSAGCSYGAEAYSIALLLHEADPATSHQVWGTDIDQSILAKAKQSAFSEVDMVNVSPARRQTHFHPPSAPARAGSAVFQPKAHLRTRVGFGPHDLLAGTYPKGKYSLILCRNVLIYFNDDAKERIYRGFHTALRPGGVLFVGGTERLSDHKAAGFELVRPFFYRKPDTHL